MREFDNTKDLRGRIEAMQQPFNPTDRLNPSELDLLETTTYPLVSLVARGALCCTYRLDAIHALRDMCRACLGHKSAILPRKMIDDSIILLQKV